MKDKEKIKKGARKTREKHSFFLTSFLILLPVFFLQGNPKSQKKVTIACAGDSLMHPVPVHLRQLLPASRIRLRDWAQGGLSSATYLAFFRRHPKWRKERVDFILLQLGTNDVSLFVRQEIEARAFSQNLQAIIRELKKLRGNVFRSPRLLMATVPPFRGGAEETLKNRIVTTIINPIISQIAGEEKITLVDQFAVMNGHPELYDPDGVHPNRDGERVLARNWLRAIMWVWRSAKRGSFSFLFIP